MEKGHQYACRCRNEHRFILMRSPENFIVTPKDKKYNSITKIAGTEFVTSTSIEDAKDVSKEAIVVNVPLGYEGIIEVGDEVLIHHNIFRDYYDHNGKMKHSRAFLYDGLYSVIPEELFLIKKQGSWIANLDYCFVKPILDDTISVLDVGNLQHTGTIFISNLHETEAPIGFTPESEYEIEIDGQLYYRMRDRDVCLYNRFD